MRLEQRPYPKPTLRDDVLALGALLLLLALPVYVMVPVVQLRIGMWTETGSWFLREDPARAAVYYEKVLTPRTLVFRIGGSEADAAFYLGRMYQDGRGLPEDLERARVLLESAAKSGHAAAQNSLYVLLGRIGRDVENWPAALAWLRQASDAGDPDALCNLGVNHFYGAPGVMRDPIEARSLYERAQKADKSVCATNLALLLKQGLGGSVDLPRAHDLFLRAARAGNQQAMGQLGIMLIEGRGAAKNIAEGRRWLRQAGWIEELAERGEVGARFELARDWYATGFATQPPERLAKAKEYLLDAAEHGHAQSMLLVAEFHEKGIGWSRNPALARSWYERASEAGEIDATLWLTDQANGTETHPGAMTKLVEHLLSAAKAGTAKAQTRLGALYREGRGVPVDKIEAYAWLSLAASRHATNEDAHREQAALAEELSSDELAKGIHRARSMRLAFEGAGPTKAN